MLNLIIAIILDSFSKVKNEEKSVKTWEKWRIITEIDFFKEKNPIFKGFLLVISNENPKKNEGKIEEKFNEFKIDFEDLKKKIAINQRILLDKMVQIKLQSPKKMMENSAVSAIKGEIMNDSSASSMKKKKKMKDSSKSPKKKKKEIDEIQKNS